MSERRHSPESSEPVVPDLERLRARLDEAEGKEYWRSLEELAETDEFQELLHREFPQGASELTDPVSRRRFLQLMGASMALAGITGCTGQQPTEKIVPYVRQPEELVPGRPRSYATAFVLGGFGIGAVVESHSGRPTKVEGNPDHPASLGATDAAMQATVLGLYDPDRSKVVKQRGRISTWQSFLGTLQTAMALQQESGGAGLRILTGSVTSPTLERQLRGLLETYPEARWHPYQPCGRDAARQGARIAFGEPVHPVYRLDRADVILCLDADLLHGRPGSVRYARDFADRRRVRADGDAKSDGHEGARMNRLYAIEPTPTVTGSIADHRVPLRASRIPGFAQALAARLGVPGAAGPADTDGLDVALIDAVAADLRDHAGSGLVVAGEQQPPIVHALAHAINDALGNAGETVLYTDPVEGDPVDGLASIQELVADMRAGEVEILLILDGNPVYDAPADLDFAGALQQVGLRVHLGLYDDETSERCHWHIPRAHDLASWSDVRAYDGTVSIVQPLIEPLYGGKTPHELVSTLAGRPELSSLEIVRGTWEAAYDGDDFESAWRRALHDGVVAGTALEPRTGSLRDDLDLTTPGSGPTDEEDVGGELEILFRPDPSIHDGRFANNGWLQELPKPQTKLTWGNAALLAPATAERLGLANEQVVELELEGRTVEAPVWILPGQAPDTVTVHLGFGRRRAGRVGDGVGFDAYALRTTANPWQAGGLTLHPTGEREPLACTQDHHGMEGRHLVRSGTLGEFEEDPAFARHMGHEPEESMTLYADWPEDGYEWGMSIDLSVCTGCNACVVGCQSENNIPVVGKTEVRRGREMHWIRIDRYWSGDLDDPETHLQPVLCMHCENAPCEVVCPVAATTHSDEGINEMTYNRCVGTRYCSNNCPYKVRRFNFFQYSDYDTDVLKLLRNPDVTVRTRGVMEKCTYCIQRINRARMDAEMEDREIRDGEVVTACQQACPTRAISFGDITDPDAEVTRQKAEPLTYGLLTELNTRPRTTYMARLRNPNPALEPDRPGSHGADGTGDHGEGGARDGDAEPGHAGTGDQGA